MAVNLDEFGLRVLNGFSFGAVFESACSCIMLQQLRLRLAMRFHVENLRNHGACPAATSNSPWIL